MEVDFWGACFETVSKHAFCFETSSAGGRRGGAGGGQQLFQHPPTSKSPPPCPPSAPLRAQRPTASNGSVHIIHVSSQSHNFPNSECRNTLEICPQPHQNNSPNYVQLHLQAWTLGVSRFILGLFGRNCRNSYPYKPCRSSKVVVGQSVIQP